MSSVPKYPAEDDKLRATSLEKRRGGNVGNSLEVLQQLFGSSGRPIDLKLVCPLPNSNSQAAEFIKASFNSTVDLSLSMHREASAEAASSFIIKSLDSNSRTIVNYNDLDEMTLHEFKHAITQDATLAGQRTWYHFEGRIPETSVACIRWLREVYPTAVISVEAEKPGREGLDAMAAEADVVFFSKSWAQDAGYGELSTFLHSQARVLGHARLVCCTWGEDGAAMIRPLDGSYCHEPAFVDPQRKVVDTIGAGDTFVAGVLFQVIACGQSGMKDALAFANELAGRKVLQVAFANLV